MSAANQKSFRKVGGRGIELLKKYKEVKIWTIKIMLDTSSGLY
jgi:hypothetical protein